MIDVEETDVGLRVVDAAKNQVEIEIDDWEPGGEELDIGYDVTETRTGSGTEIRLPNGGFLIERSELDGPRMLNMNERIRLDSGDIRCRLGTPITTIVLAQSDGLTMENSRSGIRLSFSSRSTFSLGFKEFDRSESDKIAVSPTPAGGAAALEICASMHQTETPDRSYPSERPILPSIEVEENASTIGPDTDAEERRIRFRIPPSFDYLFPLAPLAYYLGAGVTVDRRSKPMFELDQDSIELAREAAFSDEVASLLRRIFFLDCLVRDVGPRRVGIREFELLDELPLDPNELYDDSMIERVQKYLDVPFERIDSKLPDWPLAMFVEPSSDNVSTIPFLLDKLSMVFPPQSSPIDRGTLVARSLGDFYRSTSSGVVSHEPIEISTPTAHQAKVRGWIAPGNPVDAFKFHARAFENEREYLDSSSEPISIEVVLNDEAMESEQKRVHEYYHDRAEDLSVELNVLENATREELANAFESRTDFLHYIGHSEPTGLRCSDGNLSAEMLSRSRARTFFLNACGSYTEGLKLIELGSVAGAVTVGDVLDAQAAKVGADFARLYMYGYTIERALFYARGQAIMNRQYTIVGDGTHVLTQGDSIQPTVTTVTPPSKEKVTVILEAAPVNLQGSVILPYVEATPNLLGNHQGKSIDKDALEFLIASADDPIIYENRFYWPEELLEELF